MQMKIKNLLISTTKNLLTIIKRFPLTVLFSVVSTTLVIVKSELESPESTTVLDKIILCSFMGMFLFTLLQLVSERIGFKGFKRILIYTAGLVFVAIYGVLLPEHLKGCDAMRYLIIISSFFMLIFIVPFSGRGEEGSLNFQHNLWYTGTWFIYAIVVSGILFTGIAIAYAMVSLLFEVENFKFLIHAFTICWCFVAPLVFLNGFLPYDGTLSMKEPEGFVRMVVDYVLIPLDMLYILILALYFGKTTLAFTLPEGRTAYLVISCSFLGILVYYLVHRFDSRMQKGIERIFTKIFFWCMIPMVVLLWIAIIMRLSEYGVTENRYIVLMLAAWLSGVTLHGLIIRNKNFITWPAIFAAILILSIFGPWSMFSVSRSSQYSQMMDILNKYDAVQKEKFQKAARPLSREDSDSLYSSVDYLLSNHEGKLIVALMPDELRTGDLTKTDGDYNWQKMVENTLDEKFNFRTNPEPHDETAVRDNDYFQISQNNGQPEPVELAGFTYLLTMDWQSDKTIKAGHYSVTQDMDNEHLVINAGDKQKISIDLAEYASILQSKCGSAPSIELSSKDMTFSGTKNSLKYKIVFSEINFSVEKNKKIKIDSARLYLLLQ